MGEFFVVLVFFSFSAITLFSAIVAPVRCEDFIETIKEQQEVINGLQKIIFSQNAQEHNILQSEKEPYESSEKIV